MLYPKVGKENILYRGKIPKVLFAPSCLNDMWYLINKCKKEISWLGTVKELDGNFIIPKIFLIEQKVLYSETDLDKIGIGKLLCRKTIIKSIFKKISEIEENSKKTKNNISNIE